MGRAGSKRNSFFVFPPYTIPPNFVQIGAIFLELSCSQTHRPTRKYNLLALGYRRGGGNKVGYINMIMVLLAGRAHIFPSVSGLSTTDIRIRPVVSQRATSLSQGLLPLQRVVQLSPNTAGDLSCFLEHDSAKIKQTWMIRAG